MGSSQKLPPTGTHTEKAPEFLWQSTDSGGTDPLTTLFVQAADARQGTAHPIPKGLWLCF